MRKKLIKYVNEHKSVYLNYLENYRVTITMFEDESNVAFDFIQFLLDIPKEMREHLIHNIIPVGGFSLTNNFFFRFQ